MNTPSYRNMIFAFTLILTNFTLATTRQEVQQKTTEAASAAVDYSKEQKEKFQNEMSNKLAELNKQIEDLKQQAASKTGQAQKEINNQISALESKQEDLKTSLNKLGRRSGRAWVQMKAGLNKAWDSLSESYEKAKAEIKK